MAVNNTHTSGMGAAELDELLRTGGVGVLALADAEDAYAAPVAYDYDGESLLVRVGTKAERTKMRYLEATGTATLVVHDAGTPSWSVRVRGSLRERETRETQAETERDARFSTDGCFDGAGDESEAVVRELNLEEVIGRRAR